MVDDQIVARGVRDARVLEAMRKVTRHVFVPEKLRDVAYTDGPLSIGHDQTISQPYIVALMTELLEPKPTDRVLEIGTGSGYQAAVLAEIVAEVFTIEILPPLYDQATRVLHRLGYPNIFLKLGDGTLGWEEHAPYDKIIVTAASQRGIPPALEGQLREGGILVIPIGAFDQELVKAVKREGKWIQQNVLPVRFVPLIEPKTKRSGETHAV